MAYFDSALIQCFVQTNTIILNCPVPTPTADLCASTNLRSWFLSLIAVTQLCIQHFHKHLIISPLSDFTGVLLACDVL